MLILDRVMHVLETIYSGGVERRKLELCRQATHYGFETRVVCSKALGPVKTELDACGIPITTIGEAFDTSFLTRLLRLMKLVSEFKPTVLHCSVIDAYSVGAVAGRLCKVPVILMEETSDPQNRRIGGHLVARLSALLATHCIAISPSVGRYIENRLKVSKNKLTVIPNGVAALRTVSRQERNQLRQTLGITEHEFVVGSAGRMFDETHKRFGDLLNVLLQPDTPQHTKLLLCGEGKEREGLEQLASDLGVADRVVFAGFQADMAPYYAAMDVFALASEREGFGLVNVEAMLASLPVVATRVGGIPDIVVDGETGILLEPRDISAFADAFKQLAQDDHYSKQLGNAGHTRAQQLFTSERYCRDVYMLYQRLIQAAL